MEGNLDYIFIGMGTGGTITGISRRLQQMIPKCKIIGVDPKGSVLYEPKDYDNNCDMYKVEGIGQDEVPGTLDLNTVHDFIKTEDKESFDCARDLIKKEGLFIGGSCGSAMIGAIKYLKQHNLHEN